MVRWFELEHGLIKCSAVNYDWSVREPELSRRRTYQVVLQLLQAVIVGRGGVEWW